MNRPSRFHPRPLVVLAAIVLVLCASFAFAQTSRGGTTSAGGAVAAGSAGATQGTRSPAAPQVALPGTGTSQLPAGAPSPAGLSSRTLTPGTLASPLPFPAGIPSTVIAAPGTSAAGSGTGPTSGNGVAIVPAPTGGVIGSGTIGTGTDIRTRTFVVNGQNGNDSGGNTAVMGAAGVGAATYGSPVADAPRTAMEVVLAFNQADLNRDGALTRAEAQRLALPDAFEELDVDKDGTLSRGEYSGGFGR